MARVLTFNEACEALRGGSVVVVTIPLPEKKTDRTIYEIMPGGGCVDARSFKKLKPFLEAAELGLFSDGPPQSYRWRGD